MKNDKNLQFITRSISDAGQLIIYRNFGNDRKQAIGIKNDFQLDEDGLLHIPLNTQYEENITTSVFPVELFFYKKGHPFYLTANGFAMKEKDDRTSALSVKMENVEFVETAATNENSITGFLRKSMKLMASFM